MRYRPMGLNDDMMSRFIPGHEPGYETITSQHLADLVTSYYPHLPYKPVPVLGGKFRFD